jgi:hypothetical protein
MTLFHLRKVIRLRQVERLADRNRDSFANTVVVNHDQLLLYLQ